MFRLSKSLGTAVISLDLSSTSSSFMLKPFSSIAPTMWFGFWLLLPFPRWVFPSMFKSFKNF